MLRVLFTELLVFLLLSSTTRGFVVLPSVSTRRHAVDRLHMSLMTESLENQLDAIGHKLKLQVYDATTGVFGIESKDSKYGIENVHCSVHYEPSLGLELTEVAHADFAGDHRGLVLVSDVDGNAQHDTPIHVGDTIIGVFTEDHKFQESTTGFDFDDTVDVIERAKQHAKAHGQDSITLELNRLVKRVPIQVEIVDADGNVVSTGEALAGDNLRLWLMHHHLNLYDDKTPRLDQPNLTGNCGGEGVCGTCLVDILEGMEHLNKVGPQEQTILQSLHRPTWRAACKTVIGADNEAGNALRIRLHPQSLAGDMSKLRP